jgi:hypothetical protein
MQQELDGLRAAIADQVLAGPGADLEAHQRSLAASSARKEALEAELALRIPEMSFERTLRSATAEAIAGKLPAGSALIEIVRFPLRLHFDIGNSLPPARHHYVALVLRAGAADAVDLVRLGEAAEIDATIAAFLTALAGERAVSGARTPSATSGVEPLSDPLDLRPDDPLVALGADLRARLLDRLAPALGGCRRLFIAPDGALCRLPFEVLPMGDGRHVLDEYRISYLVSGRDLLRFGRAPEGEPGPSVVIAAPAYGAKKEAASGGLDARLSRLAAFPPLPWAALEGQSVAARLGVTPWMGEDATEGRVKALRSPRILHFATHGFFLEGGEKDGSPLLRSGLALAEANTWLGRRPPPGSEDGILNGEDVASMDLRETRLVVLSACKTGLGDIAVGEGVLGLRRAFVVAGARALVMALWSVPDDVTQRLMDAFYRRLPTLGPSEALREAQMEVQRKSPHPATWGAFICQGDPAPSP